MKRLPLGVSLLALALTAGTARADLHCVSDLSQAGPHGELCGGKSGPHPQVQEQQSAQQAAAAGQLVNIAAGAAGSLLGGGLTTPLSNQYQGHKAVKPVVTDDDGIKTPGTGAASDIIDSYKPSEGESYADRLAHFRELHDAEMDQRRAALEKLKGTSAEKWCKAHIGILFPEPPVSNIVNSYPNKVRAYDREKQIWDQRCGGPSTQAGYQSFTDELAALKPDAPTSPVAGTTTKAPTYEAPAAPPAATTAEPEKPAADSFADAEKELEGPPAKRSAKVADAPPAAQSAQAGQDGAADSGPSPDDSKNTNRSTEFFGEKNAKVTAKDLDDKRAPELEDLRPGTTGAPPAAGSGPAAVAGTAPRVSAAPPPGAIGTPIGSQTPRMLSTKSAPDVYIQTMVPGSWSAEETPKARCQVSCADVMDKQSEALQRFRRNSVAFPKAIIMGHLNHGLGLLEVHLQAVAHGTDGIPEEPPGHFDMTDLRNCGPAATIGVSDEHCSKRAIPRRFKPSMSNWNKFIDAGNPSAQPIVFMRDFKSSVVDIAKQREAEGLAAAGGRYAPKKVSLLDSPDLQNYWESKDNLRENLDHTADGAQAAVEYANGIRRCSASDNVVSDCFKENNKLWDRLTPMMDGTPAMLPVALVGAAKDAVQDYATDLLDTWENLMTAAADCLGGCP